MELKRRVTVRDSVFRNPHVAVDIAAEEMGLCFMGFESVCSFRIFNHDTFPEIQDTFMDYGRKRFRF